MIELLKTASLRTRLLNNEALLFSASLMAKPQDLKILSKTIIYGLEWNCNTARADLQNRQSDRIHPCLLMRLPIPLENNCLRRFPARPCTGVAVGHASLELLLLTVAAPRLEQRRAGR
jgi:hypothetical protein